MKDIKFSEQKFFSDFWKGIWIYLIEPILVCLVCFSPIIYLIWIDNKVYGGWKFGLFMLVILFLIWLIGWFIVGTLRDYIKEK